jgi:heptosyltransferase-2
MVMAHCLVQVLLSADAEREIHMLSPPTTEPLARRMPGVARSWLLDVGHGELGWRKRLAEGRRLAVEGFDQAIVLPNSFKSALVPFWARIPLRTGWHGELRFGLLNQRRRLDPERYPLMIQRFMALALPAAAPVPQPYPAPRLLVDPANRDRLLREHQLAIGGGVLVLCPGAEYGSAKRWPAEHYAEVARHGAAQGQQVWLLGSLNDRAVCAEIEARVPTGLVNLAGRTGLLDAVDLLSCSDHVVCNDSGLMHVAGALDIPLTAIFGSTSPAFTPPLGRAARVLKLELPCSPCFQRECPLVHLRCLRELQPQRVIETL